MGEKVRIGKIEIVGNLEKYMSNLLEPKVGKQISDVIIKDNLSKPNYNGFNTFQLVDGVVYPMVKDTGNDNINSYLVQDLKLKLEQEFPESYGSQATEFVKKSSVYCNGDLNYGYFMYLLTSTIVNGNNMSSLSEISRCHRDIEEFLINASLDYQQDLFLRAQEDFYSLFSDVNFVRHLTPISNDYSELGGLENIVLSSEPVYIKDLKQFMFDTYLTNSNFDESEIKLIWEEFRYENENSPKPYDYFNIDGKIYPYILDSDDEQVNDFLYKSLEIMLRYKFPNLIGNDKYSEVFKKISRSTCFSEDIIIDYLALSNISSYYHFNFKEFMEFSGKVECYLSSNFHEHYFQHDFARAQRLALTDLGNFSFNDTIYDDDSENDDFEVGSVNMFNMLQTIKEDKDSLLESIKNPLTRDRVKDFLDKDSNVKYFIEGLKSIKDRRLREIVREDVYPEVLPENLKLLH